MRLVGSLISEYISSGRWTGMLDPCATSVGFSAWHRNSVLVIGGWNLHPMFRVFIRVWELWLCMAMMVFCWSLGSRPPQAWGFSLKCFTFEITSRILSLNQLNCNLQETSQNVSLWLVPLPIDTSTPDGPLMVRNCFIDFAGNIGAIEIFWLIDCNDRHTQSQYPRRDLDVSEAPMKETNSPKTMYTILVPHNSEACDLARIQELWDGGRPERHFENQLVKLNAENLSVERPHRSGKNS